MAQQMLHEDTAALAEALAIRTGVSVDEAVRTALAHEHEAIEPEPDIEEDVRRFKAWLTTLPPFDPYPTLAEIDDDMYDINGLPR